MLKDFLHPGTLALFALAALGLGGAVGCGPGGDGDGHEGHADHAAESDRDEHADHEGEGEEEEGVVHLTADQIERSGIRVRSAGPGPLEATLRLDAVVAENEDTQSHVNPRAPGLLREIHKRLGDTVEKGDVLCEIDSVELGEAVSGYQTARSTSLAAREMLEKETQLFGELIRTRTDVLDGAIVLTRRIHAREKELESQGLSTLRPLLEAEKALQEAELEKKHALAELTAQRDIRVLELDAAATAAEIALRAAADRLRILGIDPAEVPSHGDEDGQSLGLYRVRAPRSGVIVARDATLDEFVDSDTTLFEIHDPAVAWIAASVYERDLSSVRRGQTARVTVNALPGVTFSGRVGLIAYDVSRETRTTRVRVELPNDPIEEWAEPFPLRPGMFGTVEIVTESRTVALLLPESAIVHEGPRSFVFVRIGDGAFERREVEIGARGGVDLEIVEGIEPGDDVAIEGTFVLKSAARAGELGGGHSH